MKKFIWTSAILFSIGLLCGCGQSPQVKLRDLTYKLNRAKTPEEKILHSTELINFDLNALNEEVNKNKKPGSPYTAISYNKADAYLVRANAYKALNKIEEAIEDCSAVIEISPNDARAYLLRYDLYKQNREHSKALEDCDALFNMAATPEEKALVRYFQGNIYGDMRKIDKAMEAFDEASTLGKDNNRVLGLISASKAYVYLYIDNDVKKAIQASSQAIELAPKDAFPLVSRAVFYIINGEEDNALNDLKKASKVNPNEPVQFFNAAIFMHFKGEYKLALEELLKLEKSVLANNSENESMLKNYVQAHRRKIWQYICEEKLNKNGEKSLVKFYNSIKRDEQIQTDSSEGFYVKAIELFLEKITPEEFLNKIADVHKKQTYQAFYYLGQYYLLKGQTNIAQDFLAKSIEAQIDIDKMNYYDYLQFEKQGAMTELQSL